jgi:hypothetical protein
MSAKDPSLRLRSSTVFIRHWVLLRLVPRAPRRAGVDALMRQLSDRGIEVSPRTIQRDLRNLSLTFPIECDERRKPFGWSWTKEAKGMPSELPSRDEVFARRLAELQTRTSLLAPEDASDIHLIARVDERVAMALLAAPLGMSQKVQRNGGGQWTLEAWVMDGPGLRAWIIEQGGAVVVEHPKPLRDSIIATCESVLAGFESSKKSN